MSVSPSFFLLDPTDPALKFWNSVIINKMAINSSAKYESQDKGTQLFDCTMVDHFVLPSVREFYIEKCDAFSVTYMPHTRVVTPGVADDLRSQRLDTLMNLMLSPDTDHETPSFKKYNKGKAMRTNVGFSKMAVPSLTMFLLCSTADFPTTAFGKDFDDGC